MEDLFTPYDLSLKLKVKEFDEPCFGYWDTEKGKKVILFKAKEWSKRINSKINATTAPTYQQVIDWFKDKHHIQLFPDYTYYDGFHYGYKWVKSNGEYGEWWKDNNGDSPDGFDTQQEALINAIEEALKLI